MSDFTDILGVLAGYTDAGAADYARSMLPSAIRAGIEEGLSPTAIYNEVKGSGFGISTQRFYELAGNITQGIGSERAMSGISLDQLPGAGDIADWQVERGKGGYMYRADLHYVIRDETGNIVERGVRPFSLRTDERISWGDAIADMSDVIAGGPGETTPEQTVLGIEPVAIYELV